MTCEKTKQTAGADERTPSRSEYFSWISSTNEGSTEEQTLKNLGYFRFLHDTYGMELDIYAWDAGNLDGSAGTYQTLDSPKLKAQYPRGYAPIASEAAKSGIRLGVWCGPDGFGDTTESAEARHEQMVSLCRDYNFALFKIDGVCGQLSVAHRPNFVRMMKECRKYSPDLILLNHRLELGEGMPYATTFLFQGLETYVDVLICNTKTAMHHRQFMFGRGNVPGLLRLTEDHGVCLSSFPDYFEDELIYQAFGRCLILAPEIYGNPWLLRDDEQAHLARIFNLHRRWRDILVNGMLLPGGTYPENSVARGDGKHRFLTLGNDSWTERTVNIRLDAEIGLAPCGRVTVCTHHPYEKFIGCFSYGEIASVPVEAFRAALVEVCDASVAAPMLTGCEYEVLHETSDGVPDRIRLVSSTGSIAYSDGKAADITCEVFDNTRREPIRLATTKNGEVPANAAAELERALFSQNQDSFESRSLKRSGETAVPEVGAARDAFFNQKTYKLRGPEARFAFDGRDDTFFDGISKTFFGGFRKDGGCLRVDFGAVYEADTVMLEYFDVDDEDAGMLRQVLPGKCDYSADLTSWKISTIEEVKTVREETVDVLIHNIHNIVQKKGRRRRVYYPAAGKIRYFRMPAPVDRIYKIALLKDGAELALSCPTANNLLPYKRSVAYSKEAEIVVDSEQWREGCYLATALEGKHGAEGAYVVIETPDGACLTCPDRVPAYNANVWECAAWYSIKTESNYTYFFPVPRELCGVKLRVRILGIDESLSDYQADIYLCDTIAGINGKVLSAPEYTL